MDRETFNENIKCEENYITENIVDKNNLDFWTNLDEEFIDNQLFPDLKMESISNQKFCSD